MRYWLETNHTEADEAYYLRADPDLEKNFWAFYFRLKYHTSVEYEATIPFSEIRTIM